MKRFQKRISAFLCCIMACSLCAAVLPAKAEAADAAYAVVQQKGSIGVTVCFEFPQAKKAVEDSDLRLTLSKGGQQASVALNSGNLSGSLSGQAAVLQKNAEGARLTTEQQIAYLEAEISGLEPGSYQMTLSGKGYADFTQAVQLGGYSRHLIISTAGGAFALGDVDGNGSVNEADRSMLSESLGAADAPAACDLNGDGRVDIIDLAYLNRSLALSPETQVLETSAIASLSVATDGLVINGSAGNFQPLNDLFADNDASVKIASAAAGDISIPIDFASSIEISEIDLTTPTVTGEVLAGAVELELADGTKETLSFDNTQPAGVHAIGRTEGQSVITIPLGRKVAVKKVTITVTKVEGQSGASPEFAVLTQIEFLKDIVPEAPSDTSQVRGVKAVPGDGSVTLSWNSVRNVTGYSVAYGTAPDALKQTVTANTNSVVVSGLENMKTYYFQVTATNGAWKGTPSESVSAMPQSSKVPGAPSNIRVESADRALRVSWGNTKDATMYQVYYRTAGQSAFTAFGGNLTSTNAVITGLENGTTYEVAVKAGNGKGFGPYSATASGTPSLELLELPELPTNGRLENSHIVSIVMADKSNTNASLCPNFTVDDLIDSNAATYWIAKNWSLNSTFTFTFDTPQDMNYLLLVPYLDKAYRGRIDTYTITAKDSAGETLLSLEKKAAPAITDRNYLVLAFPETKGIKSLSLALGEKTGGPRVSISEIAFYESDSLPDEIAALFSDNSFTALKSGVTAEQVQMLSERLDAMADFYMDIDRLRDELALAQNLLAGKADALGLVRDGFQSRASSKDSQYGQSASDFQPVGISALAGSTVAVYAELPGDSPVSLVPTQYFGESGIWRGGAVQLKPGRNYITTPKIGSLTAPRGGMYYLAYAGSNPEAIKLHIRDSEGVTRIPVLELSGWYDMGEAERKAKIQAYVEELKAHCGTLGGSLQTSVQNATEISTPSVLLSLPADRVLAGLGSGDAVNTMYQNVLAWEEVLFVANKTQGIIDADASFEGYRYPMSTRQNIRYMRMFAGAFMYAAGNHVGIGYGSASALVQGRPTSNPSSMLFGWGIAHEIGHNMDKLGKAEITNNIYSLAVQAWDGADMKKQTRLAASWDKIYDKTSAGRPGAANNVFVQLGMYWQLHLAYDNAGSPLKFYNEFFRAWKAGEYKGYTYDERVALIASKTASRDLAEFFTRWGMTLGESARSTMGGYAKEARAVWYLNDDSYISRLDGRSGNNGTTTISAGVTDNTVSVTLANTDPGTILGYEIRRNGTPIGFTRTGSYTDSLGEANNLSYTYSAVPIDILGNIGAEVTAGEIRIAYDKAIDSGLYTVSSDGGKITITMKNGAVPVTGIIAAESSANCVVRVKAEAGADKWATALSGAVSASQPAYFKKPGAAADDTRIWTFDAAVIEIEGLSNTNIQLLDYPGDRIDFYESATVGYLKEAFQYGDKADEVIPQGTLVVLGTYRGDPVYNTVEIQARYHTGLDADESETPGVIERPMNGYAVMFAEIPEDGAVSDTSDGFFLFVPDLDAEKKLNESNNVIYPLSKDVPKDELLIDTENGFPAEIRAVFYRTDTPDDSKNRRLTSETLWISFPSGDSFPQVFLQGTP